jgi:hypothetical protein
MGLREALKEVLDKYDLSNDLDAMVRLVTITPDSDLNGRRYALPAKYYRNTSLIEEIMDIKTQYDRGRMTEVSCLHMTSIAGAINLIAHMCLLPFKEWEIQKKI